MREGALPRRARSLAASRSSRRAIPRMAISRPMPRWCWQSRAGWRRAPSPSCWRRGCGASPMSPRPRSPARASSICGSPIRSGRRAWPTCCAPAPPMAMRRWARAGAVNVEYVSANPTGPMHVGHGRGAVVGDALAALLEKAGFQVTPRILHQRCRRAGRCARALGPSALSRGAGRGDRPDPRGLLSRRLSEGDRARAGRARRRRWLDAPEDGMAAGAARLRDRRDAGADPHRSRGARRASTTVFTSERAHRRSRRRSSRRSTTLEAAGPHLCRHAGAAQGQAAR